MRTFNVLFVDDEENVLKSYIRVFLREPIKIYVADNGMDAMKLFSTQQLDLIITDIKMPNMHGVELIETIRKEDTKTPIIIYSAYDKMKDDCAVKNLKVQGFYAKPEDYNALCEKIREMASICQKETI